MNPPCNRCQTTTENAKYRHLPARNCNWEDIGEVQASTGKVGTMPVRTDRDVRWLREAADRVRDIRNRTCEPKNNSNRRYLELCVEVSSLEWVARDLEAEGEGAR